MNDKSTSLCGLMLVSSQNDSLFHSYLKVLMHFRIEFYRIIKTMLKSYVILSWFRVTKMKDDSGWSVHDNHLPYFYVLKCVGHVLVDFSVFHE